VAQSKFTLYKYIKLKDGSWRYCKAAFFSNGKIKPNRCMVGGKEEEHSEGAYYVNHKNQWIPVGADALDAQRQRTARLDYEEFKRLQGTATPIPAPNVVPITPRRTLADAVEDLGAHPCGSCSYRECGRGRAVKWISAVEGDRAR
jgi:hypothetical protein